MSKTETTCPIWGTTLSGFFRSNGALMKLILGCIQDFINVHGTELSPQSKNSLARRIVTNIEGFVLKQPDGKRMLMHEVLGNTDNPTSEMLVNAKRSIKEEGLIAQKPGEWKHLLPLDIQDKPVVWLRGTRRVAIINTNLLDKRKLRKLDIEEADWWTYIGNIPPEAITLTD